MGNKLEQVVEKISSTPRKLFLIDGIGAILSAFLLGIVLVEFESIFGIPRQALYFLAFIPCLFAVYDFYCYNRTSLNFGFFLKIIAYLNLLYCCLSIGLAFYHVQKITYLGWIYIIIEILIIIAIVIIELNAAAKLDSKKK